MATGQVNLDGEERLVQELSQIVLNRIGQDKLVVPCLPQVANRLTKLLRDNDASPRQLGELIERDPILAAQVLRGAAANIETIDQAIQALGPPRLRNLLSEAANRTLAETRTKGVRGAAQAIWEHALGVAILARDLAALASAEAPDAAYAAGLLHDLGKAVIAGVLLEAERQLSRGRNQTAWLSAESWRDAVQKSHRAIGVAMAERWGLPKAAVRCVKETTEYDPANRGSPINFVVMANALVKTTSLTDGPFDKDDVDALVVIGRSMLGLSEEVTERLTSGLAERVRSQLE